jgi:hypothetical protein
MTDFTVHAIFHEAGHAVVALHFGFLVEGIAVSNGRPYTEIDLDSPQNSPRERFIVLAAGIAGEKFLYNDEDYDRDAAQGDQHEISERGGGDIESYFKEAFDVLLANKIRFHALIKELTICFAEAAFDSNLGSFDLMSQQEIRIIWESPEDTGAQET